MPKFDDYYFRISEGLAKVATDNPPRSPDEAATMCAAFVTGCAMNLACARRIGFTAPDIIRAGDMIQEAMQRWEAEMASKN